MRAAGRPFSDKIRYAIRRSNRPSRQKRGIEIGVSRKHLWRTLETHCVDPLAIHGWPAWLLRKLYHQKHCQLRLNWTETGRSKGRLSCSWDSNAGNVVPLLRAGRSQPPQLRVAQGPVRPRVA